MMKHFTRPLATLAIAALTACGGGSGTGPTVQPPTNPSPAPGTLATTGVPLVGVGDSLTAGYQSSGFLGDPTAIANPTTLSAYPGGAIPPGQENGWWSIMYQEVTGTPALGMYAAATSPLPLIKAPGLANQIVLNLTYLFANAQLACNTTNQTAFSSSGWASTRLNSAGPVTDLAVPGITMHEALTMSSPLTGPPPGPITLPNGNVVCPGYQTFAGDPTSGGLQSLVAGESEMFYPVLGQFQSTFPGSSLTELNVAVGMKPKLATVWLGANDILKYTFSNGQSPATDTPGQMASDLTTIVSKLAGGGAKVLVADLPMVLNTPQFFAASNPTTANPNAAANPAKLVADFATMIVIGSKGAISPAVAGQLAGGTGGLVPYLITTYCGTQCATSTQDFYLTETGFLTVASAAGAAITAANTTGGAPQWGTYINAANNNGPLTQGADFLTPSFAQTVDTLNAGYNQAIDTVASSAGPTVALVPVSQLFQALAPGTNINALPAPFTISGAPSATLGFGGGLVSWDGLHPSNLGYGLIAASFVAIADAKLGMTLPLITGAQLTTIAGTDPYSSAAINSGLGGFPAFPLP